MEMAGAAAAWTCIGLAVMSGLRTRYPKFAGTLTDNRTTVRRERKRKEMRVAKNAQTLS
jgi:hypothetical protein